jgi:hypothetical protein
MVKAEFHTVRNSSRVRPLNVGLGMVEVVSVACVAFELVQHLRSLRFCFYGFGRKKKKIGTTGLSLTLGLYRIKSDPGFI